MKPQVLKAYALGEDNRAVVLGALPGAVRVVSQKTGLSRTSVQGHIKKLVSCGHAKVSGKASRAVFGYAALIYAPVHKTDLLAAHFFGGRS